MRGSLQLEHRPFLAAGSLALVSFLELYQDRLYALLNMFALHALVLALSVAWQAHIQDAPHLYVTAAIALVFKAIVIPVALHRIIVRLGIHREIEKVVGENETLLRRAQPAAEEPTVWTFGSPCALRLRRRGKRKQAQHSSTGERVHRCVLRNDDGVAGLQLDVLLQLLAFHHFLVVEQLCDRLSVLGPQHHDLFLVGVFGHPARHGNQLEHRHRGR